MEGSGKKFQGAQCRRLFLIDDLLIGGGIW